MKKICISYLSHGEDDLRDLELSSEFINRTTFLKENCDVFVHNDNDSLSNEKLMNSINFDNFKCLLRTPQTFPVKPSGWSCGWAIGLSNHFEKFLEYELVISLTCDVYIIDENLIVNLLREELTSDNSFVVSHFPESSQGDTYYGLDFFMFKPNKIRNIFSEINHNNPINDPMAPEYWIFKKLNSENINFRKIKRGNTALLHQIDNYSLLHTHHHWVAESILKGENPNHFPY